MSMGSIRTIQIEARAISPPTTAHGPHPMSKIARWPGIGTKVARANAETTNAIVANASQDPVSGCP